jgi:hypothetical protein
MSMSGSSHAASLADPGEWPSNGSKQERRQPAAEFREEHRHVSATSRLQLVESEPDKTSDK